MTDYTFSVNQPIRFTGNDGAFSDVVAEVAHQHDGGPLQVEFFGFNFDYPSPSTMGLDLLLQIDGVDQGRFQRFIPATRVDPALRRFAWVSPSLQAGPHAIRFRARGAHFNGPPIAIQIVGDATLRLTAQSRILSFSPQGPQSVDAGSSFTATVGIALPEATDITVNLASRNGFVSLQPLSTTIPAGATTSAPLTISGTTGGSDFVIATANNFQSVPLTVNVRPFLSSLSPSSGPTGTIVTLLGEGFAPSAEVIMQNSNIRRAIFNSPTSLSTTISGWANPGPVDVYVGVNGQYSRHLTFQLGSTMALANWRRIGHATNFVAMAANNFLYALNSDGELWERQTTESDIPWTHLGTNGLAVRIAAGYNLWATTVESNLVENDRRLINPWRTIGEANDVVALTHSYYGRQFFAATGDNRLWMREYGDYQSWKHIGHANNVVALAVIGGKGLDGRLFAATNDGRIWMRDAAPTEVNWLHLDTFPNIRAMTATGDLTWNGPVPTHVGKLWVTRFTDTLLWVADIPPLPWTHTWTALPRGRFRAPEGDIIDYTIEPNAVAPDIVEFALAVEPGVLANKILTMPDGLGSSWDIVPTGAVAGRNSLWAHQVDNGQSLTFKKPKGAGLIADVYYVGDLGGISPGSRVTFRWAFG